MTSESTPASSGQEDLDALVGKERKSGAAGAVGGVAEFFGEFWYFLKTSKKWWLLPIVLVFLLLSVFILLTESAAVVPFIYTLF